jgi:hypothetical protein
VDGRERFHVLEAQVENGGADGHPGHKAMIEMKDSHSSSSRLATIDIDIDIDI